MLTATSSGSSSTSAFNLDIIDQSNLSRDNTYSWDQDGTGVTAYVLDSGLSAGLAEFGGRAQVVADFTDRGGGFGVDCANHGTSVAGLLGGSTYGVAKNVQLRAVRVLGCSGSSPSDWAIAGMDWVTANGVRPAVVNMSFGGSRSSAVNDAVQRLENSGFRTVVAAGNDNDDASNHSPSSANTTFTVGNALYNGSTLSRNPDSNFGIWVDMWAPGQNALTVNNAGSLTAFGGTSGAAPQVAGWTAIYLSTTPFMPKNSLVRYAGATSKMTIPNSGGFGSFLYTRLQFVSWINEEVANVPAGTSFTFTSSQFQGSAPYSFTWTQNDIPVAACAGKSSCTLFSPGTPGNGDVIKLITQDAAGRVWTDTQWLIGTCQDGGFSC